ncbi:MAG: hypothetical protein HOV96_19895 [Nonomuraea sp.]|nr:hypothetical protein [Nonomuraea sp.]NUP67340.1 hypothetical protein [Nonomuraea sp.]NUP79805.1 hypothetical protein [Nonomuraea sp.]NUS03528.1 hypothetical protein [Nonomuraea sp.]NUT42143.1 hypothetical protein [Thermoactinospora sp.]
MTWIFLAAGLVVAGLAVLAVAGARVAVAARTLNREVAEAKSRLEPRRARFTALGDETTPPGGVPSGLKTGTR